MRTGRVFRRKIGCGDVGEKFVNLDYMNSTSKSAKKLVRSARVAMDWTVPLSHQRLISTICSVPEPHNSVIC